jgi:hypothetical protein
MSFDEFTPTAAEIAEAIRNYVPPTPNRVDGCIECAPGSKGDYIPHFNCMYNGNRIGHSVGHCTADACY